MSLMKKLSTVFMITALGVMVGCGPKVEDMIKDLKGTDSTKATQAQKDLKAKGVKVAPDVLKVIQDDSSTGDAVKLAAEILTQFAKDKGDTGATSFTDVQARLRKEEAKATKHDGAIKALKEAETEIGKQKGCTVTPATPAAPANGGTTPPPAQ